MRRFHNPWSSDSPRFPKTWAVPQTLTLRHRHQSSRNIKLIVQARFAPSPLRQRCKREKVPFTQFSRSAEMLCSGTNNNNFITFWSCSATTLSWTFCGVFSKLSTTQTLLQHFCDHFGRFRVIIIVPSRYRTSLTDPFLYPFWVFLVFDLGFIFYFLCRIGVFFECHRQHLLLLSLNRHILLLLLSVSLYYY